MLKGKKIVIGITGSIAAFKAPLLVRLLKKEGAIVKVMMTPAAVDFVTPLTLSTLSGSPVLIDPFNPDDGSWNSHVELGQWADLYVIAPASANTLAKMAAGIADNFLLTAYLSAKCPVYFAPAMDLDMYKHPVTQKNIAILREFGNILIEPAVGELASGLSGAGRMEEPENILEMLKEYFSHHKGKFSNKKVLVTAGPTYESIDPVRFIGNFSSGLMGFELAREFAAEGAEVTLITGPTSLNVENDDIRRVDVISAAEMYKETIRVFKNSDVTVMAAAVSDFKPLKSASSKIKKSSENLNLELEPTQDILASLGEKKTKKQFLAGFALETDNESANALKKLKAKNLDLIILNSLKDKGAGFGVATNKVSLFTADGKKEDYPLKSKVEVARDILNKIASMI